MTQIELWINIATIALLIPAIFYTAKLCYELGQMRQNRQKMTELAEALLQAANTFEKNISPAGQTRPAPQTDAEKETAPAPEKDNGDLPSFMAKTTYENNGEPASEAEQELLQALRSIK